MGQSRPWTYSFSKASERRTFSSKPNTAQLAKLDLRFNDEGKKLDLDMLLEIPLER